MLSLTGTPLLEVDGLSVYFRGPVSEIAVVDNISFTVERGRTLGLVGESGSGKSMSAMSIVGLLPAGARRAGAVRIDGTDTASLTLVAQRALRGATIGTIFQDPLSSLNPVMTIGAQLVEAIRLHDEKIAKDAARTRAAHLLASVGIKDPVGRLKVYPHEMSGGMRQRVMIAIAIANSPRLLIADEPTTALDVTTQRQVLETLKEVRATVGAAMILISHDLGIVRDVADDVAVMYHGKIIEYGAAADVLSDPQHPYTAGLIASQPRLDAPRGTMRFIPGAPLQSESQVPGCAFEPRCVRSTGDDCRAAVPELAPVGTRDHRAACIHPGSDASPLERTFRVEAEAAPPREAHETAVFEVRDLAKTFTGRGRRNATPVIAVDGLSFDLVPGRTLAIVGESGCGKTTAARAILRLIEPTAGSVTVGDVDVVALSKRELRRFRTTAQIIFQDPTASLNPRQTIGELIAEPMVEQGIVAPSQKRRRVAELLELVSLAPHHASRYPNELSGGQRQRVVIARAIGLEPAFLVLDEPVSSLDVSIQAQILSLLIELQARLGVGYLFISHDLGVVRQISDDVAVMYLGRVVEQGPVDCVLQDPRHPYTQLLISCIPGKRLAPASEFEVATGLEAPASGCRFADRCPLAEASCTTSVPALGSTTDDLGDGHLVACHRQEDARLRFTGVHSG